jgi:DnaK suppressor protein
MDPNHLARFQHQLEQKHAELREALEDKSGSTAPVQLDTSIGRLSRMDAIQSQQMALGLKARQQQALSRVEVALRAIANGTYGRCRRCKATIAIERLEAQPDAVVCVRCAS